MLIALHKQARTTPHVRALIAASDEPLAGLARRFGITEPTIYKWKRRTDLQDQSKTAHRLQTTLRPGQEAMGVYPPILAPACRHAPDARPMAEQCPASERQ